MSDESTPETVPYARLVDEITKRNKAEEQVRMLEKQLASVEKSIDEKLGAVAKERDALKTERDKLVETLEDRELKHQMDRTLLSEGVSEDGVDYLRYRYSQATDGAEEAPEFSDWFQGFKEENAGVVAAFTKSEPKEESAESKPEQGKPAEPADQGGGDEHLYPWQRRLRQARQTREPTRKPTEESAAPEGDAPEEAPTSPHELARMSPEDARSVLEREGLVSPRK